MTDPALQSQIDAATAYEELFVPALFREWAGVVADAARIRERDHVLDVACGTGVLAREAATRTGPAGRVVGLDPNEGMLDLARRLAPNIEWHAGFAESQPFPDGSFGVVVSQFGAMFFSDHRRALQEMRRVLRPGGRLAIAWWDAIERMPAWAAEAALVRRRAGAAAAAALTAPFKLGDASPLAALAIEAGFEDVQVTTHEGSARFPSIRVLVEADLRGWLPVMGVVLPEAQIARILDEAEQVLAPYVLPDGSISFTTSAHVLVGAA
jgi:SAM-dependent methyltransferase